MWAFILLNMIRRNHRSKTTKCNTNGYPDNKQGIKAKSVEQLLKL